jgi:cell division protein FtsL
MTDWSSGIEIRNYGIKRVTDSRNLAGLLCMTLVLTVLAGVLVMYAWQRSQIIELGYQSQHLMELEATLLRVEKALVLETETLKDPARIDTIARDLLGMTPLRPHQLIPAVSPEIEWRASSELVLAEATSRGGDSEKVAATH